MLDGGVKAALRQVKEQRELACAQEIFPSGTVTRWVFLGEGELIVVIHKSTVTNPWVDTDLWTQILSRHGVLLVDPQELDVLTLELE